jgi:hypothetical protein
LRRPGAAPPLRLLTGNATRIADDWTANEGSARYAGFAFKLEAAPAPFLGSAIFWQA